MKHIKIDLLRFRGSKSSLFTGRPQGVQARNEIQLDNYDNDENCQVELQIPNDTTSFNPSFYLGLLFKSYQKLGIEGFISKYSFEILTEDEETKKTLLTNLDDGKRNAVNSLNNKSSLFSFLQKKQ